MAGKRKSNKKQVKTAPTPTVAKTSPKVVNNTNSPKNAQKEKIEKSISEKSNSDNSEKSISEKSTSENSVSSESKPKTIVPPHSIKVDPINKVVNIRVTLTRIPAQFVEYHPTETNLVVHTLKYSKKLYLEKPFPDGIRVLAGEDSEAKYEAGILTASLPIVSEIPETYVQLGKRRTVDSSTDTSNDETAAPAKKKQKVNENTKLKQDKSKNQKNAKNTKQQNPKKNNKKEESSADAESVENVEANKKKKKLPMPMLLPDATEQPSKKSKNNKKEKSPKKDDSDTTVTSTEELSNKDTSEELSESKKSKQFTTKESAINILESVSSAQQNKINSKLSKEKAKMEWQVQRKTVQEKRKANKLEKKQKEREEAAEILQQKSKEKKAAKKSQKVSNNEENNNEKSETSEVNGEGQLKSILKAGPSATKKSVQFSPTLCQIKPIAKIHDPVGPSLTLQRYQLRSQLQQLAAQGITPPNKKKNDKRFRRR